LFTIYFSQLKFELNLGPSFFLLFYSIFKVRCASFVKRLIMVTSVLRFVNGLFSSVFLSASTPEAAGYLWLSGSLICLPDIEFIVRTRIWQLLFSHLSSFFQRLFSARGRKLYIRSYDDYPLYLFEDYVVYLMRSVV